MSITQGPPLYQVIIDESPNLELLKTRWLAIEQTTQLPFFMTWAWISCWINTYSPELVITYAFSAGQLTCIGLFTLSQENRRGFVKSHQYRLNQTGSPEFDQIWMEYNDFLCLEQHASEAPNACIHALMEHDDHWNEIIISMMRLSRGKDILAQVANASIIAFTPRYSTDLTALSGTDSYLQTLSSNTRYQIRNSMRLYESNYGSIQVKKAQDIKHALVLFHKAGEYHKKRWPDSGYNNPAFIKFHTNLIKRTFNEGRVELYEITSGKQTIAILYYHIVDKTVYFYLQGLLYGNDKKMKPGLVAHALMTQHYFDEGKELYDYMGGYSQYKVQLASQNEDLVTVRIQRPSLQFSIEKLGQKIKQLSTNTDRTL